VIFMPSASARLRACSIHSGARSIPVTSQKRLAAEMAVLPLPVATSRTLSPERRSAASHSSYPIRTSGFPILAYSPEVQTLCILSLMAPMLGA